MSTKKKNDNYMTVDEILEKRRKQRLKGFATDNGNNYQTADEIIEAGYKQGIWKRPEPMEQPSTQNMSGRQNLIGKDDVTRYGTDFRLWKQNQRTKNETLPNITQNAISDFAKEYKENPLGYDYISRYDSNTPYSKVSDDIDKLEGLKGGAARRGKDTSVYDLALEKLKSYASSRYDTNNPNTTVDDKKALYDDNKREINKLHGQLDALNEKKSHNELRLLNPDGTVNDASKDAEEKELENRIGELSSRNKAIETQLNNDSSRNKTVEELQKEIDSPQKTMSDIDLNDEATVSEYLNHDREAVDFFMNYRRNNAGHDPETEARYQNLLNTIEAKVNATNEANSRYNTGEEIGFTDSHGRKYNKQDYLIQRVAQNRINDITADADTAKSTLEELSAGNRNLTNSTVINRDDLNKVGWEVDRDTINFGQAYSSATHDNAAVFSPVVYNENGEVERILTPYELEQYANNVLAGAKDSLGLKMTDTYYGSNSESLANENQKRIRRLSERYYNNSDLQSLIDRATINEGENETLHNELAQDNGELTTDEARKQLEALGVDADEIVEYQKLQDQKQRSRKWSEAYSEWSAGGVPQAAIATTGNIVASPVQALEWMGNLGESLIDHFKAGTNELSVSNLPNIDDDLVTNLSDASTSAITEAIRENIKGDGDNDFLNEIGDLAANTYGGVTSGIQSAATVATCYALLPRGIAEAASLAIIAGEAGNQAYHDTIENGGTVGQAVTYSVASAANEVIGEKLSVENLFSIIQTSGKQTAKDILESTLKQSAFEMSEEVVTEGLNEFADRIVNGDQATYYQALQQYLDMGYSEEEAKNKASSDFYDRVLSAAYGGFVGGLVGGGMTSIGTKMQNAHKAWSAGQSITDSDNIQNLLNQAQEFKDNDSVRQLAEEVAELNSKQGKSNRFNNWRNDIKTAKSAGNLFQEIQEANAQKLRTARENEIKDAIKSAYSQNTGEDIKSDSVRIAADTIYDSIYSDKQLTEEQEKLLSSETAQSTIRTVLNSLDIIDSNVAKAQKRYFQDYLKNQELTNKSEPKSDADVDIDEFNTHEDDGKIYTEDGTEQFNIDKNNPIAYVGSEGINLRSVNGQTENARNLSIPTSDAVLIKSIEDIQDKTVKDSLGVDITPEIANTLYQGYHSLNNDMSVSAYMQEAKAVLYNGYIKNTAIDNSLTIPQSLRNKLYSQGSNLRNTHTESQQEEVISRVKGNNTKQGNVSFRDGMTVGKGKRVYVNDNGKTSYIGDFRQAGIDTVSALAESLGFDVVFYRSTKDGKGRFSSDYVTNHKFVQKGKQAPSGFWRGGKMYIDVNAGMSGEGLILFTASHELVHMMKEGSPKDFKAFSDFIVQNYAEQGVDINDLIRAEMARSTNLIRDEAFEEVIADSAESFFRDTNLNGKAKEFYRQNPSAWERIRRALKRIIDAIKETYFAAKSQSDAGRITARSDIKQLEQAYDLWVKGIIKSAENLRNMSGEKSQSIKNTFAGREALTASDNSENINREYSDIDTKFSIREEAPPKNTVVGYKVFRVKDGKLYPPMVANPGGADTPVGVWLNADVGERAPDSKTGRAQVKGKGGMSLSFRPGWHLGDVPRASQFDRKNPVTGKKDMFPSDFVWAECDCAADVDYQDEAMSYGYTENGKFRHAYAGLPRVPENGYYKYRTNPRPDTVPWIITGAIKVNRILSDSEVADILESKGITPPQRQGGNKTLEELGLSNDHVKRQSRSDADYLSAVERGDMETAQKMVDKAAKAAGYTIKAYHQTGNDFTVFDIGRKGAGQNDDETPSGIFLKPTDKDIRVGGKKQMPLYVNISSPLEVKDRFDLVSHYRKNIDGYEEKKYALSELDDEYARKYNDAEKEADNLYAELRRKRFAGEITKEQFHEAIENGPDKKVLDEWEAVVNRSRRELKRMVTEYFRNSQYDGVIIKNDAGSFGRSVKTYIALNNTQVKSSDPATYNDDGNVIPLSERFNTTNTDIRYMDDRNGDLFFDVEIGDSDSIQDNFVREYESHYEDIGEVLKNISDIDIAPSKVSSVVNRVLRENYGNIDKGTRELLSTEIQIALDQVNRTDSATVMNTITDAVRDVIADAYVVNEKAEADYQDLLSVFKGKKFYLSDEQIADLKEHKKSLKEFKDKMFGYRITIANKDNLERSINGGYKNAQQLSLEGLHDILESPDDYLGFRADQWDEMNYHAPIIIEDALDDLKKMRKQRMSEVYSTNSIDEDAVSITAQITGGIVEAKYNSKKNPYITKLVDDLKAKRSEAVKKQKEKNKKKLAELKQKERERAEKREQKLKEKYQEQREKTRDSRKRTELRHKVRNLTESLEKRLLKPKGQQYVPRELIAQTIDVLNAINLDTGRSTKISEKIAAVKVKYDQLQKDELMYAMYNPVISEALENVSASVEGVNIMKMSLDQLKLVYDVIKAMDYVIRESVKMTNTKFKQDAHQLGREWIAEIRKVPKEHLGILSGYVQTMLSAERFFNRIAGFKKNSVSSQLFDMLNKGQLKMTQLEMEFTQTFDDLINNKQIKSLFDTKKMVDIGLVDEDGEKVHITRGMMLSLYMHLLNEDNARHVMNGGLTVPNMKDYYKGDMAKAYGNGMQSVRVGEIDYSKYSEGLKTVIEKHLSEYEIEWINAAHKFFDVQSRNALNEATMQLYGFKRANVDNYFPIHTDKNYRAANFENITKDMSLENIGFMKERVKASNPILLEDIVDVINTQISHVSKYCGMTMPIRNFQKVYGTTTVGFETSVQKELNKKFSSTSKNAGATKYIDNLITDLSSGRGENEGAIAQVAAKARGNLAQATLTLNPRVAIAQTASLVTASPVIGNKAIRKALVSDYFKVSDEEIAEITPLFWLRRQGYANTEIGDIRKLRNQKHKIQGKFEKALNWINAMDSWAVRRLFVACKFYMQDNYKNLKPGTDEYKMKLSEVYNKVIETTQPNYTTLQRPDILRNPNALVKSLTMFMTQRLQNFNIVYDAIGTYKRYRLDFKNGVNGVTAEDVKQARAKRNSAIVSQVASAATIVGMKLFADVLLHSMFGYRDKDDELTAESVSLSLLDGFADTIFGNILFGSDLYKLVMGSIKGDNYEGVSLSGVDTAKDFLTNFSKLLSNTIKSAKGESSFNIANVKKIGETVCLLCGIPLKNAEKIGKAIYYWTSDISNGTFMESGVNRSLKQNINRYESKYYTDEEEAKKLLMDMINEKVKDGTSEKDAKQNIKRGFTSAYKQRYIDAVRNNNTEEIKSIRKILLSTGLYGSLSEQDKAMKKWLDKAE